MYIYTKSYISYYCVYGQQMLTAQKKNVDGQQMLTAQNKLVYKPLKKDV
jgi:hypothetical protein